MTYSIWAVLNVITGLAVLYLLYRLTKAINYRFGKLAAVLFLIGAISISYSNKSVVDNDKVWTFKTSESVQFFQREYSEDIVNSAVFNIRLHLLSLNNKDKKQEEPLKAFSTMSGLAGYQSWTTQNLIIGITQHSFKYSVMGQLDWKLLGFVIYRQDKTFVGEIPKQL